MALKTPTPTPDKIELPAPAEAERVLTGGTPPIVILDQAGDDQLLAEFGMEEHPQGGFHGLLEVIRPARTSSST
jgi:hypothetical protein